MTAAVSIPFREMLLKAFFNRDTYSAPSVLYAAVTSNVGLINQAGATLREPTATAYGRAPINVDSASWTLSGFGEVYNIVDVNFPPPLSGEDWGYLGGWALLDAPTSGTCLAVGSLIVPTMFTSDLPPVALGPGALTIGLTS